MHTKMPVVHHVIGYTSIIVSNECQMGHTTYTHTILSRHVPKIVSTVGSIDLPIPLSAEAEIS